MGDEREVEVSELAYLRGILGQYCRSSAGLLLPAPEDPFDWSAFARLVQKHDVVPLVYDWLHRYRPAGLPQPLLDSLRARSTSIKLNNLRITQELLRLAELFSGHGVSYIPLKGPVLTQQLYGNLGLREFGDLDLLVPRAQLAVARRLLTQQQYRCIAQWPQWRERAFERIAGYHYDYMNPDESVRIELHWAFSPPKQPCRLDGPPFWRRITRTEIAGKTITVSPPEDVLLYLCLHGARHWWSRLKWIMDVGMLIHEYPNLDWDRTARCARDAGMVHILDLGVYLAQEALGVRPPADVEARIAKERPVVEMAERIQALFLQDGVEREPDGADRVWYRQRLRERLSDRLVAPVFETLSQVLWRT